MSAIVSTPKVQLPVELVRAERSDIQRQIDHIDRRIEATQRVKEATSESIAVRKELIQSNDEIIQLHKEQRQILVEQIDLHKERYQTLLESKELDRKQIALLEKIVDLSKTLLERRGVDVSHLLPKTPEVKAIDVTPTKVEDTQKELVKLDKELSVVKEQAKVVDAKVEQSQEKATSAFVPKTPVYAQVKDNEIFTREMQEQALQSQKNLYESIVAGKISKLL